MICNKMNIAILLLIIGLFIYIDYKKKETFQGTGSSNMFSDASKLYEIFRTAVIKQFNSVKKIKNNDGPGVIKIPPSNSGNQEE